MVSVPEDTALTPSQIEDLRFAAKKMTGASRRKAVQLGLVRTKKWTVKH